MFKKLFNRKSAKNNNEYPETLDRALIHPFLYSEYQKINVARLQHLNTFHIDIEGKSVLEFGAGIGDHTLFYLIRNCKILATDGRQELADYISHRFGIETMKIDIEKDISIIKQLPKFDIIHCFGILYHINNPKQFLDSICYHSKILLLESCVSPDNMDDGQCVIKKEDSNNPTQSCSGIGCRPTRRWIYNNLISNYSFVYMPKTQPKHIQFPIKWDNIEKPTGNIRAIFIASHKQIVSPILKEGFVRNYEPW